MIRRRFGSNFLRRFPGTVALVALTVAVFFAERALGGTTDLRAQVRLGALRPDRLVEHYELWRLVMPMFLHHGVIHLALNGLALVQLGPLVEGLWGSRRMVSFYVGSGVVSALASAAFTPDGYAAAVGASGAIMGLAGVLLGTSVFGEESARAFLVDLLGQRLLRGVLLTLAIGIGLWFVMPIVDNWGHIGGLATGLAIAFGHPDPVDRNEAQTTIGFGLAGAAVIAAFVAMGVRGGDAMATIDLDTARTLSVRASRNPGGLTTADVLLEMLTWYDKAGAGAEGLDRFERGVDKFDGALPLQLLAAGLLAQSEAGADRDVHLALTIERWCAIAPDDPNALNALAWHLVTRTDVSARDPARAERLARESLARIPDPDATAGKQMRAAFLDTLAEALFQLERFDEARVAQTESVKLARQLDLDDLPELDARLRKIEAAASSG